MESYKGTQKWGLFLSHGGLTMAKHTRQHSPQRWFYFLCLLWAHHQIRLPFLLLYRPSPPPPLLEYFPPKLVFLPPLQHLDSIFRIKDPCGNKKQIVSLFGGCLLIHAHPLPSPDTAHFFFTTSFSPYVPLPPWNTRDGFSHQFFTFTNNESRGQSQFLSQHFALRQPPPCTAACCHLSLELSVQIVICLRASLLWGLFL